MEELMKIGYVRVSKQEQHETVFWNEGEKRCDKLEG
jgi:DNA invertase Pin-like site-specific DNA recombinase